MKASTRYTSAVLVLLLLWTSGCVKPGDIDQRVIGRYQRVLADRGPQRRTEEGLEVLQPLDSTQPPLQTVVDEETGRTRVLLSLREAIYRALSNNLDIRLAGFSPSISREEMIQAAAIFDAVIFARAAFEKNNTQIVTVRTAARGSAFVGNDDSARVWTAGIRKRTITGGTVELAWTMSRTFDQRRLTSRRRLFENVAALTLTQPLLRDAGPEFNLAGVRIARLSYKLSMEEFRRQVEQVMSDVTTTYWLLIQARRDWVIQKALLDRTVETAERIDKRRAVDATEVEFKQAQAAVETRRAGLIRAEKTIDDAQDQLVRLIGDSQINLLGDYEVLPTTRPNVELVQLDVTDQLLTALRHSPLLEQARIGIAVADINVKVAQNQALPRLDLVAGTNLQGLGGGFNQAREHLESADFVSYNLQLEFEAPLGNAERAAEVRRQKLDRLRSITTMQLTADTIATQVRERVRQVQTAHEEMIAQRRSVEASRDQLDALDATEQLRRMTPEFLQVKLSAQEALSNAARSELRAIVDYNVALVNLAQVTGTLLEQNDVELSMPAVLGEGAWVAEETKPGAPEPLPSLERPTTQPVPIGRRAPLERWWHRS